MNDTLDLLKPFLEPIAARIGEEQRERKEKAEMEVTNVGIFPLYSALVATESAGRQPFYFSSIGILTRSHLAFVFPRFVGSSQTRDSPSRTWGQGIRSTSGLGSEKFFRCARRIVCDFGT